MTSAELRQSFLDFFQAKEHTIVKSASLMPSSPNLLFTNAGMNQFVPYFLGERSAPYKRAADTQKCIRAGGKHNDLEDVGFDTYHHTLFEMLGNWSFGDYFKEEAITWAWELLTKIWKLPKERLYATVYKPGEGDPAEFDQEAYNIWKGIFEKEGLDPAVHIINGNKKDNFWMMGDTGPCGPCSEVHIDLTPEGDTQGKLVNEDSPFCIEIWNLVFIQFNAEPGGSFVPLKEQHVDTGMGFERVAGMIATTQNFTDFSKPPSNYNSDLFTDLFNVIGKLSGKQYQYTLPQDLDNMTAVERDDCAFRVLADHIRTLAFSIADGIIPGNEGRNYVLRRILRRAVHYGRELDLKPGFFSELVEPLVKKMGPFFSELEERKEIIYKIIKSEEEAFDRTIDKGMALLDKLTASNTHISGDEAFDLYSTHGFPTDLTELIAKGKGVTVDMEGFKVRMEQEKALSRESQTSEVISVAQDDEDATATEFVGFETNNWINFETTLQNVIPGKEEDYLVFEKTPFYAEMGGQVGDQGTAQINGQSIEILDTLKNTQGVFLHKITQGANLQGSIGESAQLTVNKERREAVQRHHSATHILNYGLRAVLGDHITQAGSLVDAEHLRFDFSHFEAVTAEQINEIESIINERIIENTRVDWFETAFDDKPEDCIATFGEKYGSVVRVVDIGSYSKELCGGTHVQNTGEIGLLKITTESAVAAGTRRIEAVAGESAYQLAKNTFSQLQALATKLSCKPHEIDARLNQLMEQKAELEKKLKSFERKGAAEKADQMLGNATEKNGVKWIASKVEVSDPKQLQSLAVQTSKQLKEGVVVMGAAFGTDKVTVVALCSPQAIEAGNKAGDIVRAVTTQLGGKGGGKPDFAMGGGKDVDKLDAVLQGLLK